MKKEIKTKKSIIEKVISNYVVLLDILNNFFHRTNIYYFIYVVPDTISDVGIGYNVVEIVVGKLRTPINKKYLYLYYPL